MLRFFRRIRHRLLNNNKFSKYLLYAVGEIMLVVIGILIALQIDNWNEDRMQRKTAILLYQNTRPQLLEDRRNIEGQISYNGKYISQFEYAIGVIRRMDRDQKDSLGHIAGKLVDYSDFDRQGNIYQALVNSGDIKLLKNENIKKRLRGLEETYLYINRMETIHYDAILQMIDTITKTVNLTSGEIIDENMLYNPAFQNLFALSLRIIHEKEAVYLRALNEIDFIISLIDEELNHQ
jgi:hypothetical protein